MIPYPPHSLTDHSANERNGEGGFPHSEIAGSKLAHSSPTLIAACHVLHRLYMPRHPPNALTSRSRIHTINIKPGHSQNPPLACRCAPKAHATSLIAKSRGHNLSQIQHLLSRICLPNVWTDHAPRHRSKNPFTMSKITGQTRCLPE